MRGRTAEIGAAPLVPGVGVRAATEGEAGVGAAGGAGVGTEAKDDLTPALNAIDG